MNFLGIDPGKNGGFAMINKEGCVILEHSASKMTPRDIVDVFNHIHALRGFSYNTTRCFLERVHSMPKQGVKSTFSFGENFGTYIGILTAMKIPFNYVSPGTWQRAMGCLSKGDKNVTKRKAQELFPNLRMTHAIADALLIAEYGRRKERGEGKMPRHEADDI